jgi:hypothetical protein
LPVLAPPAAASAPGGCAGAPPQRAAPRSPAAAAAAPAAARACMQHRTCGMRKCHSVDAGRLTRVAKQQEATTDLDLACAMVSPSAGAGAVCGLHHPRQARGAGASAGKQSAGSTALFSSAAASASRPRLRSMLPGRMPDLLCWAPGFGRSVLDNVPPGKVPKADAWSCCCSFGSAVLRSTRMDSSLFCSCAVLGTSAAGEGIQREVVAAACGVHTAALALIVTRMLGRAYSKMGLRCRSHRRLCVRSCHRYRLFPTSGTRVSNMQVVHR